MGWLMMITTFFLDMGGGTCILCLGLGCWMDGGWHSVDLGGL